MAVSKEEARLIMRDQLCGAARWLLLFTVSETVCAARGEAANAASMYAPAGSASAESLDAHRWRRDALGRHQLPPAAG
jgi:hypothetical protein